MAPFLSQYIWTWLAYTIAGLVHVVLILNLVAVGALVFIWLERKISGRIQDRLGPTRVGGKFGWLQTLADGIKLLTKEDLAPAGADHFLFRIAPYVSFCASIAAFIAIPFAGGEYPWIAQHLNVGVFFVLAVLGLEVFGVILAGYSSASKWSLFGAMREAAQVVSYEVPLGMCVVVPVLIAGSLDLVVIGDSQAGSLLNWFIFHDPFTFIIFWVYCTCATASVNRAPFDLAEAESELVAGFHTEYSGLRWSFFFMAEYGSMFSVSILASILFLGGWHGPIPVTNFLDLSPENGPVLGYMGQLIGAVNVIGKGVFGVCIMMWIRWTLPRLRIDQVMATCLKYCTPIAAAMFLGATLWQLQMPGKAFFGLINVSPSVFAIGDGGSATRLVKPAESKQDVNEQDQIARKKPASLELAQKGL
ncbi:NADH-quinone oxidoreductase subunit NuoH [Bythopirellula polymerisocia]|uniref:NADH-quinone oxidoreductase subunit H n=1 Tax=Bythopirellula polymerisocia TaxID=2528003 RepID=A0A5C6CT02_9BACT|nr:NADH-quinone oxidoreductase subunit NuoH [Bythopirellula polymerisocia]TWU25879.1 NADH-quinone oxidoreductase subunit H [Bythopirellula polymerisocia]